MLRRVKPGSFPSLNDLTTQSRIFNRLERELNVKWYEYQGTHFDIDEDIPFEAFSRWIRTQAKIHQTRHDCGLSPSPVSFPNSPTPIALHISSQTASVPQDTHDFGAISNDSGFVTLTRAPESTHRNDQRQSSHIKSFREQPTEFERPPFAPMPVSSERLSQEGVAPISVFKFNAASFSRTCPVTLSHPSSGLSIEGLAIIDDQASITISDLLILAALKILSCHRT